MDTNEITKEVALKDLSIVTNEEQFISKTEMPEHIARLIFAAYQKGVGEYQKNYWDEQEKSKKAEQKVVKLALFVADILPTDNKNDLLPF
jgi:hypothetical protein